jgi:3-dehydroquinate synthase
MSANSPIRVRLTRQPHTYPIHFRSLEDLPDLIDAADVSDSRCVVITDETVDELYGPRVIEPLTHRGRQTVRVIVPPGESSKSFEQLTSIYNQVLGSGIDRQTPVIALGGGVVGDLAGFAAASLLRGVPLIQVPTTLIGQADSAIGGKTGINHETGKNLIGAFYQPEFVCADLETLHSLPQREWTSGLAEVIKYAFIADPALFEYLTNEWSAVRDRQTSALEHIVPRSAAIKARIVEKDEKESGVRAILNFGHTVGHAIEKASGYGHFTHGEAIALGMVAALHLSASRGGNLSLEKTIDLVGNLPLYATLDPLSFDEIWTIMQADKKVQDEQVRFVLLDEVGSAYVTGDVDRRAVRGAWAFTKEYAKSPANADRT